MSDPLGWRYAYNRLQQQINTMGKQVMLVVVLQIVAMLLFLSHLNNGATP